MNKTKLIATLGPSSKDKKTIKRIIQEGASGVRINMVYGDLNEKKEIIKSIRKLEEETKINVSIIAEIKGRTLRIGDMPEAHLSTGEKLVFQFGVKRSDDMHIIPVPYDIPASVMKANDKILLADGRIIVRVDDIKDFEVEGTVIEGGILRSKARIALRKKSLLNLPPITEEDEKIIDFLVANDVDAIMIPDVLAPEDIAFVKSFLESYGELDIRILARIENADALPKLGEIAKRSDGVVFAKENIENMLVEEERPIADMFLEDLAVRMTIKNAKPIFVIVPTLESLLYGTTIKRHDLVVLTNLITKGFDGLILCSETAIGKNPTNAIKIVHNIIKNTELRFKPTRIEIDEKDPTYIKFNRGLLALAEMISAKIAIYTTYGRTALALTRFRPETIIFSFTDSIRTARYLNIIWGIKPIYLKHAPNFEIMGEELVRRGLVKKGETIVFSYGWRPEAGSKQYLLIETV